MKLTFKGTKTDNGLINSLVNYLESSNSKKWLYSGLTVELDPTVDYTNQNILVRWADINEGFNDKLFVYSLAEFKSNFKLVND